MRRGVAAIFATVLGTMLMIGAKLGHHADEPDDLPADVLAPADGTLATQSASAETTPSALPSGSPLPTKSSPGAAPPSATTSVRPAASPTRPATPATTAATGLRNGTFAGAGVTERYGVIKVTIVVSGGRITNASATCTNPCEGESASISSNAIGKLNARVLTAQSASIQSVSGATYTSSAYKQSLAAAINQARA
ncbi:MAG: FMN-binding protein [Hamadaea sp.]|uniref:FMN-binding protein n=1 Tax=Hamadaea sp. TaxID=2024425 RepID=UPI0017BEE419|nr:FMN-binding protein [Hamadaea sp.]NUT18860.1 FMN-binding protein [Hamadaea sp.]